MWSLLYLNFTYKKSKQAKITKAQTAYTETTLKSSPKTVHIEDILLLGTENISTRRPFTDKYTAKPNTTTFIIFLTNSNKFFALKTCLNHLAGFKFSNFGAAALGANKIPT